MAVKKVQAHQDEDPSLPFCDRFLRWGNDEADRAAKQGAQLHHRFFFFGILKRSASAFFRMCRRPPFGLRLLFWSCGLARTWTELREFQRRQGVFHHSQLLKTAFTLCARLPRGEDERDGPASESLPRFRRRRRHGGRVQGHPA